MTAKRRQFIHLNKSTIEPALIFEMARKGCYNQEIILAKSQNGEALFLKEENHEIIE